MSTKLITQLRYESGQGLMDCKKMIEQAKQELGEAAESDILKKALELLQKNSSKKIEKKASRAALHGLVLTGHAESYAYLIELNCETDFVARNENFVSFSEKLAEVALANKPADLAEFLALDFSGQETVEAACKAMITKTGENIKISRFIGLSSSNSFVAYNHGQKLGVLVEYAGNAESAKDIALHVAANSPVALDAASVPAAILDAEKKLFAEQAQASGKPENVQEKMVEGKLKKFLSEVTLMDQGFVKDDELKVADYLAKTDTQIISFQRIALGEAASSEA